MSDVSLRRALPFFALIILCGAFAVSNPAHAQQAAPSDGTTTLTLLDQTNIPVNDRIDLARRLQGVTDIPAAPDHPVNNYKVGDRATFWATDNDANKSFQVTTQLIYATPHVFMWFEVGANPDINAVKQSADTFENHVYPTVHQYFGSERSPGIDGDVHLYILHVHHLGAGIAGYFSSADTYPNTVVKTSNQHNMFFMNLDNARVGTRDYEGTLAHEFQHMAHNANHVSREGWLDEGMAETSRLLNGYAQSSFAPTFLFIPTTQLNTWSADSTPHYGAAYLFSAYLAQRFGPDKLKLLITSSHDGLFAFDDVLQQIKATDSITKQPITTTDLYADWQAANLLNNTAIGDGRYGYAKFPEKLPAAAIAATLTPGTHTETTNQYGTIYLQLTQPGTYTFKFQGQPTVRVIPTDAHSGSHFWWAGRLDKSDARLTHDFDLSSVKSATLDFWVWHWIEKEWDYGNVEVSTDSGHTWKALSTPEMDSANPNDTAYGPGYTGSSGVAGFDDSQSPSWIEQKIELTPYAGQKIKVRFEYITDDALVLPGMALDDIQIPEIGYSTDAESDNGGWQSEGWARMDNTLPETYLVQAIAISSTAANTTVKRLLSPTDGINGQWTITVGNGVKRVVIAVSGMTRYTDEPAPFSYTLTTAQAGANAT